MLVVVRAAFKATRLPAQDKAALEKAYCHLGGTVDREGVSVIRAFMPAVTRLETPR